jgi:hypothetical protein
VRRAALRLPALVLVLFAGAAEVASKDEPAPPPPKPPAVEVPFLRRWLLAGPFPNPDDDFLDRVLEPAIEVAPRVGHPAGARTWIDHRSITDWVDPERALGRYDWAGVCAFAYLHVAKTTDAFLWFGHDDSARVYLDGIPVHHDHLHWPKGLDGSLAVPLPLSPGVHRLFLKVEDVEGPTSFWARIANRDGTLPNEVRTSLSPKGLEPEAGALADPGFYSLDELYRFLPVDKDLRLGFDDAESLSRVATTGVNFADWPHWVGFSKGPPQRGPSPGFSGALGIHPAIEGTLPARVYRKVRLQGGRSSLRVRVAAESGASGAAADFLLKVGVFDGKLEWLAERVIGGGAAPGWNDVVVKLRFGEGKELLLVLEAAYGGGHRGWEEAYVDEFSVE